MYDVDSWQEIASTLSRNKLRAFLTACGVFWGIFMLIVMLGIGKGLQRGTHKMLGGMVNRSVFVWSQRTTLPYRGLQPGRTIRFRNQDIEALRLVPGVEHVAPRLNLAGWRDGVNVSAGTKTGNFAVIGDAPAFRLVEPVEITRGRFVNRRDMDEERKVAVIGDEVRRSLFANVDPIGQYLQVRGVYFQVVGEIVSHRSGDEGDRVRSSVFVPFSTFQQAFNERDRVGWFALTTRADADAKSVEQEVRTTLLGRHRVDPQDTNAIGSFNMADQFRKIDGLFRGIQLFVWFVGTLTLFAGVLGVSNILLITVKERTREFGVRKALGATPWMTVTMVLKEAVALTALAGYLGLVAGVVTLELLSRALAKLENPPITQPEVDIRVAVAATLVLIISGAIAGIVPARHAASISPVEALRAE